MDIELLIAIGSSSLLTSFANGIFNRRKNSVEIADKINQMASRLADDQREEIDALNGHIMQLQKEYREVKEENKQLRKQVEELKIRVENYKNQAVRRKEENVVLEKEVAKLQKSIRGLS